MTTRKHFKRLVRERMARTGERYTVARAHLAPEAPPDGDWELRGGLHADTAAFANVLANTGVVAPHTGAPLSEAMVLGTGGGVGAGYILWEFAEHGERIVVLGFRRQWQYPGRWAAETAARLGLHAEVHETGGAKGAARRLDALLDRGLAAIVWADAYRLGHRHLPERLDGRGGGPVVVYGRDGDRLLVDDRSTGRLTVPAGRLADARARVPSYKHRLIEIDPALVELDGDRLRAAVEEGLALQVQHLSARSDSFSLPAWSKWARTLTGAGRKAWPAVFADGRGLGSAMASIHAGAGGGRHLRSLYAQFLEEAAELLGRAALRDAAAAWRAAAAAWERVVDTALPPDGERGELRALIDAGAAAVERGDEAAAEAERLARERWALQARLDARRPGPESLFTQLAEAVAAVYAAETAALQAQA
jgi:Butirosin biosynthesis protein H, N-terminal